MTDEEIQSVIDHNVSIAKIERGMGIGTLADYIVDNKESIKKLQTVTAAFIQTVLNSVIPYQGAPTETAEQYTFTPKEVQ